MHDPCNSRLSSKFTLTQSSLQTAIASTVAAHRNGHSDQDMADEWGVSAGTVNNAQNKRHDLALMNWLKLGKAYGPDALNTALALVGAKAVPDDAVTVDVKAVPADIARVLPLLIDLFRDGRCCNADVRTLEQAGAIDTLLTVAEWLRQRRNDVRLEAVA